jgi:hypothetical protein
VVESTICTTVREADPDVPEIVPLIVADPGARAVTAPVDDTVATFGASEAHVTVWLDMRLPAESITIALALAE